MVIERIKDSLGSNDPSMVTTESTCPKCGTEGAYISEFEEVDGELHLDNIYCQVCGDN